MENAPAGSVLDGDVLDVDPQRPERGRHFREYAGAVRYRNGDLPGVQGPPLAFEWQPASGVARAVCGIDEHVPVAVRKRVTSRCQARLEGIQFPEHGVA